MEHEPLDVICSIGSVSERRVDVADEPSYLGLVGVIRRPSG